MSDLSLLGWDDGFADAYRQFDRADTVPARVLRADRGVCTVLDAAGVGRASLGGPVLICAAADPARLPCPGDWVVLRRWPDRRTTVEYVLPRRTALLGPAGDAGAAGPVLAANMDTVAVVEPISPRADDARVERLLALAGASGARPVVVLSKSDAAPDLDAITRRVAAVAPGVPVLPVSASRGDGLTAVRALLGPGRTLALLGPAGAGKSTLVDALAGATVMPVREVRGGGGDAEPGAGRRLVPVPGGGAVLDTPGIREIGLRGTVGGGARHRALS
ncbi:ribosome biogenesis GTPase [Krasilnikovia cinnamomea]|uniref:Ribosome biogenesis GTPase n=1 Tax=Krasilnikovia cinnamomea TaxID=349313 RepID=A0A4Q7ZQM5_9ACTN|nr:GTPase RsgA [Krasilnikovia cinnamomea]RZU53051.1 ribosome biogenesis GTPase [Krasilnikovia cinnamomea]